MKMKKTKRDIIIETVLDVIKILVALAIVSLAVLALWGNVFREARKKAAPEPGTPMETVQPVSAQPMACTVEIPQEEEEEEEPGNVPAIDPDEEPTGECGLDPETDWIPFEYHEEIPLSESLQCILWDSCQEYEVPYSVMLGLIQLESNFDTEADNGTCYGLCQLSRKYFPSDLPPGENIMVGTEYLGKLIKQCNGDIAKALTCFNAGHDTGERGYANVVLRYAETYGL